MLHSVLILSVTNWALSVRRDTDTHSTDDKVGHRFLHSYLFLILAPEYIRHNTRLGCRNPINNLTQLRKQIIDEMCLLVRTRERERTGFYRRLSAGGRRRREAPNRTDDQASPVFTRTRLKISRSRAWNFMPPCGLLRRLYIKSFSCWSTYQLT